MTEEPTKRKRRRRSKEKTDDDAVIKQEVSNDKARNEHTDNENPVDLQNDEQINQSEQVAKDDDDEEPDEDEPKKRKRKRKRKKTDDTTTTTSTDNPSTKIESTTSHTVFIEGLPFHSSPSAIQHFFESHNCSDIVEMRLPTWQDSGRLRGFGHVVFGSLETKKRALEEVNGKELGGRYVSVLEAKEPKAGTFAGE